MEIGPKLNFAPFYDPSSAPIAPTLNAQAGVSVQLGSSTTTVSPTMTSQIAFAAQALGAER